MKQKEPFSVADKIQLAKILARELRILIISLIHPKKIQTHFQLCVIFKEIFDRVLADAREYEGITLEMVNAEISRRQEALLRGTGK